MRCWLMVDLAGKPGNIFFAIAENILLVVMVAAFFHMAGKCVDTRRQCNKLEEQVREEGCISLLKTNPGKNPDTKLPEKPFNNSSLNQTNISDSSLRQEDLESQNQ